MPLKRLGLPGSNLKTFRGGAKSGSRADMPHERGAAAYASVAAKSAATKIASERE